MTVEFIISILGLLGASNIITFFMTKRKYNSEVDSQQIKNMDDSFEVYKKVMHETLAAQDMKIETLQKENESLRTQVNELQKQVINLVSLLHSPQTAGVKDIDPIAMKDL